MTAFLSWVDYSSAERQRMRQAVALFKEKEARDELGVGTIRDAISNALFPGTSVIQTRLRYALFIPWLYQKLEGERRASPASVANLARKAELGLVQPLVDAGDLNGIIGRRARDELQRLPSSVYWLALQTWGIFQQDWSLDDYHRSWDQLREFLRTTRAADDRGVQGDRAPTWHIHLPSHPEPFPEGLTFDLTAHEAAFLQERIRSDCPGTLLAHAVDADSQLRPDLDADAPWLAFPNLPPALVDQLEIARRFALLMRGAAFVYNLALARKAEIAGQAAAERVAEHAHSLAEWFEVARSAEVAQWPLQELWAFCAGRANVTPRTREFVEAWQHALGKQGASIGESPDAALLVEQREWQLKGSRSRFRNPRALELWGGSSGTGLMTYRWGTVRQLLSDLYAGLDREGV